MILLKDLIEQKIKLEVKDTIDLILEDLPIITQILTKITNEVKIPAGQDAKDILFNFFPDRGDWTPQDKILNKQNYPLTLTYGVDSKGNPDVRNIYPVAIVITDAIPGAWQKSSDLDAYGMIYNFEVLAEDYFYEEIQLILSKHSEFYNQFRDTISFASDDYTNIVTYTIPSFGNIQNAYGRKMFSSFLQFSMLFIRNGVLGNEIELFLQITPQGDFFKLPHLTFSTTKSKIGDANTFQGDSVALMLHNQQTLTFDIGLLYTKSTVTTQIVNEILEQSFLTKTYNLKYSDSNSAIPDKIYKVMLSDASMTANIGEFVSLSTSWVLAKELD
jgi:hypothetical protein